MEEIRSRNADDALVDAIAEEIFWTLDDEGICRLAAVTAKKAMLDRNRCESKADDEEFDINEAVITMLFAVRSYEMYSAKKKNVAAMSAKEVNVVLRLMINCAALFDAAGASCKRAQLEDKAQAMSRLAKNTMGFVAHFAEDLAMFGVERSAKCQAANMFGPMTSILEDAVADAENAAQIYESLDDGDHAEKMSTFMNTYTPVLGKLRVLRWVERALWVAVAGLGTLVLCAHEPLLELSATACFAIVVVALFLFPEIAALSL